VIDRTPLRIAAPDPNCFERAAIGMSLLELLDPRPVGPPTTICTDIAEPLARRDAQIGGAP
jgi:hypothetical protein